MADKGTVFTRGSAERIAATVRKVEGSPGQPLRGRQAMGSDTFGRVIIGKTDSSHAKGASGVVSIYDGATQGSESDTTINVTAWNRFGAIASGKWVAVVETVRGYEIIAAEC